MPFRVPSLAEVRSSNRDYINSRLTKPLVPNSTPRIVADAGGGLAHLNLQYLQWLSLQLLPDTAETEWLDRWGNIWLVNADGSLGRKMATAAVGTATVAGTAGTVVPLGTVFTSAQGSGQQAVLYQTTAAATIGSNLAGTVSLIAINGGAITNLVKGDTISLQSPIAGVTSSAVIVSMMGGSDQETDDELRSRVLQRIQRPPMGGSADDYVKWALEFPGVTRAWTSPLEMGIGTVTLRFMMDDLRAASGGFPNAADVAALQTFLDSQRPVTVLDLFTVAPIPQPISFTLSNLKNNDSGTLQNIQTSVKAMLFARAAPAQSINGTSTLEAQTIYASWISYAISSAVGVNYFDLTMADAAMPTPSSIATLGNIVLA